MDMTLADMTPAQRATYVAKLRGRDTRPELIVRAFLEETGVPFEAHASDLPGTPDVAFRALRVAVFVHGCFWHGSGCRRHKPKMNRAFWDAKFAAAVARDRAAADVLQAEGWRVLTIWECQAKRNRTARRRLLAAVAPERRLCHNCAHVAVADYAHCRRCRKYYTDGITAPLPSLAEDQTTLRRRRKALELCVVCGLPADTRYSMCPAHAVKQQRKNTQRAWPPTYHKLAAKGLCRCHAPVKPGSKRCEECLRKMRQAARKRNKRYVVEGRCRRCPNTVENGRIWCTDCRKKVAATQAVAVKRFIQRRRTAAKCVRCAEPSTTYHCDKCRGQIRRKRKKPLRGP